jgi:hypothetical protein
MLINVFAFRDQWQVKMSLHERKTMLSLARKTTGTLAFKVCDTALDAVCTGHRVRTIAENPNGIAWLWNFIFILHTRRCVLRMDHFCPWVNNCVGFHNHKAFMLFCFWAGWTILHYHAFFLLRFMDLLMQSPPPVVPVLFFVFDFCIFLPVAILILSLFGWQIRLLISGKTTMEYTQERRARATVRKPDSLLVSHSWPRRSLTSASRSTRTTLESFRTSRSSSDRIRCSGSPRGHQRWYELPPIAPGCSLTRRCRVMDSPFPRTALLLKVALISESLCSDIFTPQKHSPARIRFSKSALLSLHAARA